MGKICFVNPDSLNVTPYFSQYLDCCDEDYEVIYWDRSSLNRSPLPNEHVFRSAVDSSNPLGKLVQLAKGYWGFKTFASKILKSGDYRRVVALTGNTGAILSGVLGKRYPGRYLVDVRDFFLENLPPYRHLEKRALDGAAFVVASSPAYTAFLGERPLDIMHNDQKLPDGTVVRKVEKGPGEVFVLASIGTAKNLAFDKAVIDYFANDERFLLRFAGRGYEQLEEYVRSGGIYNVTIRGEFPAECTLEMYEGVDAVLNMYGNHHPHFDYALPNKLYYAARLGLPIVVCPDTYLAQVVEENHLGLALDLENQKAKERLLQLREEPFLSEREKGSARFIAEVEEQNAATKRKIAEFLRL